MSTVTLITVPQDEWNLAMNTIKRMAAKLDKMEEVAPLMTLTEAADYVRKSKDTLMRQKQDIGFEKRNGALFFKRSDLDAWRLKFYNKPKTNRQLEVANH